MYYLPHPSALNDRFYQKGKDIDRNRSRYCLFSTQVNKAVFLGSSTKLAWFLQSFHYKAAIGDLSLATAT